MLLAEGCKKVYVIQNMPYLTGESSLISAVGKRENVEVIVNSVVHELIGDTEITGVWIKNTETGEDTKITLDGIFVAIGQIPENDAFRDVVELDARGYVAAGEDCLPKSDHPGIFVAGDCRTKAIRQVTTATADGAVAALAACRYIDSLA